jgi:WD40 repeat protein
LATDATVLPHRGAAFAGTFSPDGKCLATASWFGDLVLWDGHTFAQVRQWNVDQQAGIWSLAFVPDDQRTLLLTVSRIGTARLWDCATGQRIRHWEAPGCEFTRVGVSPDGRYFAVGVWKDFADMSQRDVPSHVVVWDISSQADEPVATLSGLAGRIYGLEFSPDGKYLAAANFSPKVGLWEVGSWKPIEHEIESPEGTFAVAFSDDGKLLATGSGLRNANGHFELGEINVWATSDWHMVRQTRGHQKEVRSLDFLPDGQTLLSAGNDHWLGIWPLDTSRPAQMVPAHTNRITRVSVSPNGALAATSSDDSTVKVWRVDELLRRKVGATVYSEHQFDPCDVAFVDDGQTLCSTDLGGQIRLLDARTLETRRVFDGSLAGATTLAWDRQRQRLLVSTGEFKWQRQGEAPRGHLEMYDLVSSRTLWSRPLPNAVYLDDVSLSPDGRRIALAEQDHLVLLDAETGAWVGQYGPFSRAALLRAAHNNVFKPFYYESSTAEQSYTSLAVSPRGRLAFTESHAKLICIVDTASGDLIHATAAGHNHVTRIRFSPDGRYLASGGEEGDIHLWDALTMRLNGVLAGHTSEVVSLAFSPDSRRLASGGMDKCVRVWDVDSHECLLTLREHDHWVTGVAFSPDGSSLASARASDGRVVIRRADVPAAVDP